jgi:hypothetical protein
VTAAEELEKQLTELIASQDEFDAQLDELERKAQVRKTMLVCVECLYGSDEWANGWKAYLDGEGGAVFCPDCVEREFDS